MIPKIIHYCWFGNTPKDPATQNYIKGWQQLLPDYTFKEWTNQDLATIKNNYTKQAFQASKWAFVADYMRLYALYHEGGIYLDTDVELRKSFDTFLDLDFFIGSELYETNQQIGTAVIGAKKNSPIIKRLLEEYENISFIKKNNRPDLTPNTRRLLKPMAELGFSKVYTDSSPIYLDTKNVIYPVQYFSKDTPESYAVHHFSGSWIDDFGIKTKINIKLGKTQLKLLRIHRHKDGKTYTPENGKILWSTNPDKKSFHVLIAESKHL